ncbi:ABC transporter substrate-binding protein [Paenibacillus plantarum]|uniref:ABC transporter substrate-binding protein n=1 Tax=Paenibacillus plantarum TaxID=2654975 RepID=UPI0014913BFF|nr:ABC transporter substrate-binding protein [Paenibacillus plantarum]
MNKSQKIAFIVLSTVLVVLPACSNKEVGGQATTAAVKNTKAENVELRATWSGTAGRHERTLKVIELFEKKYPNIKINAEYSGTDGFTDKLNTQIAGGNAADLINVGSITDLVTRSAVLDITPYVTSKEINLEKYEPAFMEPGKDQGKYYGISLGTNGIGFFYNSDLIKKAGMEPPKDTFSWEDYEAYGKEVVQKLGPGYYAFADQSRYSLYMNYFLRQSGKTIYKDGKAGFDKADIAKWYGMWDRMRKEGLLPTPEEASTYTDLSVDTSIFPKGKTVFLMSWLNQLTAFQNGMKDELQITALPSGGAGAKNGLWVHPSQFWTINKTSKHPKEAAQFINFFINDEEAAKILGSERGIPNSSAVRDMIKPTITATEKKFYSYFENYISKAGPKDLDLPNGTEFNNTVISASQKVMFNKATIDQAAQEVVDAFDKTIKK